MRPESRSSVEDGAVQIEWAAVLILAAAMLAILVISIPGPVSDGAREAICTIIGGRCDADDEADDPGPDPADPASYLPSFCEMNASSNSQGFTVKIIARGGSETGFQRTEMSDGTVIIAANPSDKSVGLEFGFGGKIKGGKNVNIGAGGEASAGFKKGRTVAWKFPKKDRAKAEELERRIVEDGKIESNPVVGLWNSITGGGDEEDLPEPDMVIESKTGKVGIGGMGGAFIKLPETSTKKAKDLKEGEEPEEKEMDMGLGVNGGMEIEGGEQIRTDKDGPDALTARTTFAGGSIEGGAEAGLGVGAGGDLKWQAQIRETRDKKGNLKGILLRGDFDKTGAFKARLPFGVGDNGPKTGAKQSLGSQRNSTLVDISLDTPEERALGEKFLRENAGVTGTAGYFFNTITNDHGFATDDPGPDADPWEKMVFDKGKVWTTSHHREITESEIGAEGKFGISLGATYQKSKETRKTEDAQYLGAPEHGKRAFSPYDSCIAR